MLKLNDNGPEVQIQEPTIIDGKKPHQYILAAFLEVLFLAVTGFFVAVTLTTHINLFVRILCGAITFFDLYICACHFSKSYTERKTDEHEIRNKLTWKADYDMFQKLQGTDFELMPTSPNGRGKLRVFFQSYDGDVDVWYSKGIYQYKSVQGESVIDFDQGFVRIPPFLNTPIACS